MKKLFTYCVGVASAIAVISMPAKAETKTESVSWQMGTGAWTTGFSNYYFELPTFNSSIGNLTGVRFELDTRFNAGVYGAVLSPETTVIGSTALTADMVVGSFDSGFQQWDILYETDFEYSFTGGYESHVGPSSSRHVALDLSGDLSPFLGDYKTLQFWSVLALEVNTSATHGYPDASILGYVQTENTFSIQYTYVSAVPEPETYAMMLAGFGLLGVMTRRR